MIATPGLPAEALASAAIALDSNSELVEVVRSGSIEVPQVGAAAAAGVEADWTNVVEVEAAAAVEVRNLAAVGGIVAVEAAGADTSSAEARAHLEKEVFAAAAGNQDATAVVEGRNAAEVVVGSMASQAQVANWVVADEGRVLLSAAVAAAGVVVHHIPLALVLGLMVQVRVPQKQQKEVSPPPSSVTPAPDPSLPGLPSPLPAAFSWRISPRTSA